MIFLLNIILNSPSPYLEIDFLFFIISLIVSSTVFIFIGLKIKSTEHYTDFEVFIRPTTDFKAHLMSRGGWLQVVFPKSLAKEILEWHHDAIKRYEDNLKE